MSNPSAQSSDTESQEAAKWAPPVSKLTVTEVPGGAINLNVEGRQIVSPLQGFGQMWQKTYRVRLPGVTLSAVEVMEIWKAEFPKFQPHESRFYPPMNGVGPGKLMFIDLDLPVAPGLPNLIPVTSGVMILYADDESFTVMTPQGFPVSGWNTFSVFEDDGCVVAQIQSIDRATDPIYEFGTVFMGGARRQEENWSYVLRSLARHFGVNGQVQMDKVCVDPRRQWSEARNIWYNAGVRTLLYRMAAPTRRMSRLLGSPSRPARG
jgi:hypothetical protein